MKKAFIFASLLVGSMAMAQGTATGTAPSTAPTAKKMDHKTARAECLKENKDLKGKALSQCVKSKQAM